jgi:hypothetical protein
MPSSANPPWYRDKHVWFRIVELVGILTRKELETWTGYLDIIGPHPVFLAEIDRWQRAKFMSRNFAEMFQIQLLKNPLNKKIIDKFYPKMDSPAFLDGLPEYGKRWS